MDAKTRTAKKEFVQEVLMRQVSVALGYWQENLSEGEREELGVDGLNELQNLMQAQADRIAKMFGYEKAWMS